MTSLHWQTSLQNRQCHALCTLSKTSKCWLDLRPIWVVSHLLWRSESWCYIYNLLGIKSKDEHFFHSSFLAYHTVTQFTMYTSSHYCQTGRHWHLLFNNSINCHDLVSHTVLTSVVSPCIVVCKQVANLYLLLLSEIAILCWHLFFVSKVPLSTEIVTSFLNRNKFTMFNSLKMKKKIRSLCKLFL